MKINKIIPIAMSALLIGSAAASGEVFAKEGVKSEVTSNEKAYIKVEGIIESVEKGEAATLYTIKQGEERPVFAVTEDTLVFDNTGQQVELDIGDKVSGYTDSNKPMIMIYPPQYSPEVVIVEKDESATGTVGVFDDELVDPYLKLQLNVDETTDLSSVTGKQVKVDDLKGKDLLVFYTTTTRSIPEQTTPEKVVVLDGNTGDQAASVEQIIIDDHYMVDGVKMVPLRLLAEKLGYVVDSTGEGAIVSKGAPSYTITRGQKEYGYNKSLRKFEVVPDLLEPKKTYVPIEFIDELMK
ncbi:copper amine oxidase [Sporosarcina sp. P13]|uniref:stalk domain-containing protein n=1 Tax=Sporosarcina sp. P13 TaxID=2048263 RepID=UPI000C16EAC9|nr:stalk domain-containing protein [Sporosarcina sp. P13]PIC64124.1 copper amine oxidase [Sporosarcina sp. P13]